MGKRQDYDVGYKKTSKSTQFKKGQSGNPRGRPKGSRSLKSTIEKSFRRKVTMRENGQTRQVTVIEAVLAKQLESAMKGNLKSAELILKYSMMVGDRDDAQLDLDAGNGPTLEDDQATIRELMKLVDAELPEEPIEREAGDDE